MTNKEFRAKIYAWLNESFQIKTDSIGKPEVKKLKKILEEFNPTQPAIKEKTVSSTDYKNGNIRVWRDF